MLSILTLDSILEVLVVILPVLLTIAFVTILERKAMASMQRRLGPNIVGFYGSLQAFADALKLLLKEYISPTQANLVLFFLGPIITLVFSLLGFAIIPYGPGLAITDFNLGILYVLAVSSLSTYGILLAGWSANSKYAFLGSLRSTAQLISYELILSSAILLVVLLTGSLSLTVNIEAQRAVWFIAPLVPMFIVFLLGAIAETNRAPFDLAEAESELVSGFMTEHAAVIFVFFFLAEYGSIVLICILLALLFIGGYLLDITTITFLIQYCIGIIIDYLYIIITIIEIDFAFLLDPYHNSFSINPNTNALDFYHIFHQHSAYDEFNTFISDKGLISNVFSYLIQGIFYGLVLGLKAVSMIFLFIWGRASFPRIRFDQLMSLCWTILLPIVIGFIILLPCLISGLDTIVSNFCLLFLPFICLNGKTIYSFFTKISKFLAFISSIMYISNIFNRFKAYLNTIEQIYNFVNKSSLLDKLRIVNFTNHIFKYRNFIFSGLLLFPALCSCISSSFLLIALHMDYIILLCYISLVLYNYLFINWDYISNIEKIMIIAILVIIHIMISYEVSLALEFARLYTKSYNSEGTAGGNADTGFGGSTSPGGGPESSSSASAAAAAASASEYERRQKILKQKREQRSKDKKNNKDKIELDLSALEEIKNKPPVLPSISEGFYNHKPSDSNVNPGSSNTGLKNNADTNSSGPKSFFNNDIFKK